jgi:pSer/pThr/pTyr-binding forkhead associated (FHA) protein
VHDGRTRKTPRKPPPPRPNPFLECNRATLVVIEGPAAGSEYELDRPRLELGRGPELPLSFADEAMSREHAAFEADDAGFRVRDLGSTNGIRVNGSDVLAYELKHGDRVEIGEHVFQYLCEPRERSPRTYVLEES